MHSMFLDLKLNLPAEQIVQIRERIEAERNLKPLRTGVDELNHELLLARKRKAPQAEIEMIKSSIRREKENKWRRKKRGGGKYHDYRATLVAPGILRLRWNGIRPNIRKALDLLGETIRIEPELFIKSGENRALLDKELEDRIIDLVEKGQRIEAVALVRDYYGIGLAEAKKFVDVF